jgi:hypothetical protein
VAGQVSAPAAVPSPLDGYFGPLDAGELEAAAAAFSEDAVYIRPSLADASGARSLVVVRGRDAVLEWFRERGRRPYRHEIRRCAVDGRHCFVEGVVTGGEAPQVFVASATLDDDGLITRYLVSASEVGAATFAEIERTRR